MRKILFSAALLSLLVLTACAKTASTTPTVAAEPTITAAPTSAATAATEVVGAKPGECQVTSSIFPPEKSDEWRKFAPISASDYVQGPENAVMTIIEYSDFT